MHLFSRLFKPLALAAFAVIMTASISSPTQASFNPNLIIDDAVFTNKNSMSVTDIQNFLNSRVPVCDTWHSPGSGSQGNQPPWTCLKNYSEGGRSGAQIIYDAAQLYGINPQVIIVTLQKENGLITDTWPYHWQYRTAMGMGCPDGAPCDSQYFGFANQINQGVRHLKNFYDQNPNWFIPHRAGNNNVKFHPNGGCGTAPLHINKATSALYSYTPYQPNGAALANMYGTGDGCSSYGNRNFWRDFTNWFGSTTQPKATVVMKSGGDKLYLSENGQVKRWIPSPDVMDAWGLNTYPIQVLSAQQLDGMPEGQAIQRLVSTSYATYFMDGGKRRWITSAQVGSAWGLNVGQAVRVANYAIEGVIEAQPLSIFAHSTDPGDGRIWIMDVGLKHYVPTGEVLADWGAGVGNLTYISPAYLNTKTEGEWASDVASVGETKYLMDDGQPYRLSSAMATVWGVTGGAAMNIDPIRLVAPERVGTQFVQQAGDGKVNLVDKGVTQHIPDSASLQNWGYSNNLTVLSAGAFARFTTGSTANKFVVENEDNGQVFVIDGQKRYINGVPALNAWTTSGQVIPEYSGALLSLMGQGSDVGMILQAHGDGRVFTLDRGKKLYIPSGAVLNAWGHGRLYSIQGVSPNVANKLADGGFATTTVASGGTTYLLDNGRARSATTSIATQWGLPAPLTVDPATVSRLESGDSLKRFARIGGTIYLVNNAWKSPLNQYIDAFGVEEADIVTLNVDYFPTAPVALPLIQSTDPADGRVWFINQGQKFYVDSFPKLQTLGLGSVIYRPYYLSPAAINAIPDGGTLGNPTLIKKANSGVAVLAGYGFYAFPNLGTLQNWIGANQVMTVSDSIFNQFRMIGVASTSVLGFDGKIYSIENGTKRWVSNFGTYVNGGYSSQPLMRPPGFVSFLIPDGTTIP